MPRVGFSSFLIVCTVVVSTFRAPAQNPAPMKAGLWQIQMEREENGKKMPSASDRMQEHMKTMTPERRKQFEDMMHKQGIDPSAGGVMKICYSQKMVDQGSWTDEGICKTDFSTRTATSWKWHSVCHDLGYEGDGEARFSDRENFVIKSSGVMKKESKTTTSNITRTGKWLSADCGDLKPMDSKP
jgi:hypothetical protein